MGLWGREREAREGEGGKGRESLDNNALISESLGNRTLIRESLAISEPLIVHDLRVPWQAGEQSRAAMRHCHVTGTG